MPQFKGCLTARLGSKLDLLIRVEIEQLHGGPANGCQAVDQAALPLKMVRPRVATRVEEFRQGACLRIVSSDVAPLVQIAVNTGQREIIQLIVPAVLFRQNVLDVERGQGRLILMETTIFTAVSSTLADGPTRGGVHLLYP